MKKEIPAYFQNAIIGNINELPMDVRTFVEGFIDMWNNMAYDRSFWQDDASVVFGYILSEAKKLLDNNNAESNDKILFHMFQIIVLNFAYTAEKQPKMRKFIGIKKTRFGVDVFSAKV